MISQPAAVRGRRGEWQNPIGIIVPRHRVIGANGTRSLGTRADCTTRSCCSSWKAFCESQRRHRPFCCSRPSGVASFLFMRWPCRSSGRSP